MVDGDYEFDMKEAARILNAIKKKGLISDVEIKAETAVLKAQ
jgi:hypothetical protein